MLKVIRNLLLIMSSIQHYVFRLQRRIDVQENVFEHLLNS